jgi:hypothetical protein
MASTRSEKEREGKKAISGQTTLNHHARAIHREIR